MLTPGSNDEPPRPDDYGTSFKGQLDLFAHSRTVILLNDLIDCLLERNTKRVRERLGLLRAEVPGHPALDALRTLHQALECCPVATTGAGDTAKVVEWLDHEVSDAAARVLGNAAATFLRSLWHELAVNVSGHPYDPIHPESHCAYCYLRAGDAPAALRAAAAIHGHERDPFVLQWMTLARYRTSGWHTCRAQFFTLALTAPQHLPATLTALADSALQSDWERFWLDCTWLDPREALAAAWFPAWYLIEHPSIRIDEPVAAADADAPPVRAFRATKQLSTLEPGGYGRALVSTRAELRAIDLRLFEHYMRRREA